MSEVEFNSNPIFYTERLCLRPLTVEDAPQIFALRSDTGVNQYLDRKPCNSLEDAEIFISGIMERTQDSSLFYWAVCLNDRLIGVVCLFDFSKEEQSTEIGFELLPKFQGNGYMHEATTQVIHFIFTKLVLKKILALVHLENSNSINLLQKLNFIKIDHLEKNPKSNLIQYLLKNYIKT